MSLRTLALPAAAALAAGLLVTDIPAAHADLGTVKVRQHPFTIYGTSRQGFVAVFNGVAIPLDDTDEYAAIQSIVEGDGRTFVIVSENCGGSACANKYRVFDVSTDVPKASEQFGTNSSFPGPFTVKDGAVHVTIPKGDGSGSVEFTIADGKVTSVERSASDATEGPASPPGGDYVAFAAGKSMNDAFTLRALAGPLRKALGPKDFDDARKLARFDFGSPFKVIGGEGPNEMAYAVAEVSQPHESNLRWLKVGFDADGGLYLAFSPGDGRHLLLRGPHPTPRLIGFLTGR